MEKVKNNPGIYYRLDKAGKKTYYLRLKQGSRQTWRRVGPRLQDAKDLWYAIKLGKTEDALGVKLPRKTLFHQLSADYFEYYKNKAKERNWDRVRSIIKHLDGFFGRIEVPKISLWTVENYIRHRRKWNPKVRFSTLNLELDYLIAILNRGVDRGVLDKIPKISKLPVQESRARILSGEELEIIIPRVSRTHRDAIMLALDTGMREGELFRLRPLNVDLKTGIIHVESDTKNLKNRDVPMTTRVREILTRRFKKHGDHLFEYKTVSMMSQTFGRERSRILEEVPRWRFHDLRHCFCTALLRKGVDPYTVMKLAGHSNIKMVTRYLHTDNDLKKAAIAALEEIPAVTKKKPNERRPPDVTH